MAGSFATLLVQWLSLIAAGGGEIEIPTDRRIEARVTHTVSAPAEQSMHMPTDVAVDDAGRLFVADGANDRILRFAPQGGLDLVITEPGGEKLKRPIGIAVDIAGQLWIADTGHHRLVVVSSDGKLIERIDLPASAEGHPFDPAGLATTRDGQRTYIVDNDNHRIAIRDNVTGELTLTGRFGHSLGRFRWPFMICVAQDGYVYISEAIGARVQRMNPSDRWAGQISRWGVELGKLYRPKGVAISPDGELYVSDSTLRVIQVFDAMGRLKGVLTDSQGKPLRFEHPMGMCFDKAGRLYVVESSANRVAVVVLAGESRRVSTRPAGHGVTEGRQ